MMIMVGGIDGRFRRERVVKRTVRDQAKGERAERAKINHWLAKRRPAGLAV
jgi:hypothetical protein